MSDQEEIFALSDQHQEPSLLDILQHDLNKLPDKHHYGQPFIYQRLLDDLHEGFFDDGQRTFVEDADSTHHSYITSSQFPILDNIDPLLQHTDPSKGAVGTSIDSQLLVRDEVQPDTMGGTVRAASRAPAQQSSKLKYDSIPKNSIVKSTAFTPNRSSGVHVNRSLIANDQASQILQIQPARSIHYRQRSQYSSAPASNCDNAPSRDRSASHAVRPLLSMSDLNQICLAGEDLAQQRWSGDTQTATPHNYPPTFSAPHDFSPLQSTGVLQSSQLMDHLAYQDPGHQQHTVKFESHLNSPASKIMGRGRPTKPCEGTCNKNFEIDSAQDPQVRRCNRCWKKFRKDGIGPSSYQYDDSIFSYEEAQRRVYPDVQQLDYQSANASDSDDFKSFNNPVQEKQWVIRFLAAANEEYEGLTQVPQTLKNHLSNGDGEKEHELNEYFLQQQKTYNEKPYNDSSIAWYTNEWVNIRMRFLVRGIITLHAGGPSLYPLGGDNKGYNIERGLKCSARLQKIEEILRYDKRTLIDVIEGRGVLGFVANPKAYHARKMSNFNCNEKKRKALLKAAETEVLESEKASAPDSILVKETTAELPRAPGGRGRRRKAAAQTSQQPKKRQRKLASDTITEQSPQGPAYAQNIEATQQLTEGHIEAFSGLDVDSPEAAWQQANREVEDPDAHNAGRCS